MSNINEVRHIDRADFLKRSRYTVVVPANIDAQTSPTSYCEDCYSKQLFSKNLQRFLIDYTIRVSSKNPLTDR